jgi:FAD:protein FMN transferase
MMRAMPYVPRVTNSARALLVLGLLASAVACTDGPGETRIEGRTMGTTYRVLAYCEAPVADIAARVDTLLREVNDHMSTYQHDSVLSRFNAQPPGEWVPVSEQLVEVVDAALALARRSDGAFDVTVGPLVNVWGFGPGGQPASVPTDAALAAARERVGFQHLEIRSTPPAMRKTRDTYVDLSAIAKGWGVDRVAQALIEWGCPSSLVEIGGDLRVGAPKPDGTAWRVGIEVPDVETRGVVHRVLEVTGLSVATSGDYRNFAEWDGARVHHIIDPRSGRPAVSALKSVTVVHESAMWADGYATLIHVLGPEAGYRFGLDNELPVMLIVQTDTGFEERVTPSLDPLLVSQ